MQSVYDAKEKQFNKEIIYMNLQNGYKVIYEKAAEGERTFYAAKSTTYPNVDDTVLASFTDKDFCGKVVYEYQGKLYVSKGTVPAFDDNGESTDTEIEGFDQVFKKASGDHNATTVVKPQSPHAEAIETNGDSHGMLTIEGTQERLLTQT